MSLRTIGVFLALFIFSGLSGLTAQSIDSQDIKVMQAPETERICTFEPTHINANHFIDHREITGKSPSMQASSEFRVTYENACNGDTWPQDALEAFDYAMNIWETHLQSSVPVRIEATWRELDENILGSAGPTLIAQVPAPIGQNNTWYAVAQASAMTGIDIIGTNATQEYDIRISINCDDNINWYFGTDTNTPSSRIDFVTVVLHEIGHGIGFIGSMRADPEVEIAEWGFESNTGNNNPIIYDRFVEDGEMVSVLNESVYPNQSRTLYDAVTGQNNGIVFTGMDASMINASLPVPLYAPFPWRSGSSYSHLDQVTFNNTENALMRPRIDAQSAIHTPGPVFCGMLSDMGWPLGPNCIDLVGIESAIAVEQSELNFGVTNVGTRETITLTIENLPSAEDPLSGRLVIDDPHYFIPATQRTFTIAPGNSIDIPIRYNPTNTNIHNTELLLFHNSADQPNPLRIQLLGEALEENRIFVLDQNFPNPFSNLTQIEYALTGTSMVRLDVYNSSGQLISTLVNEGQGEGRHTFGLNAGSLASGMYLYRLRVDGRTETRKFMLVK
ncbi:hypothetical protein BH23BAC3_BH23BAC3_07440 [soil metagenome]